MNSRAIELYKQASEFAYKICKEEGRTGGPTDHICNTLSTGRFAELIVKECVQVCKSRVGNSDYNTGRMHCVSDLKEHFGVEE